MLCLFHTVSFYYPICLTLLAPNPLTGVLSIYYSLYHLPTNQWSEDPAWWVWTFISLGLLSKVLPAYFTLSSSHSHGRMGNTSDRPDGNVLSGFGCWFLLFPIASSLGWQVSTGVLILLVCNSSVYLWMMSLLFSINDFYEQCCFVKLDRLSSWKPSRKLKGHVLLQDSWFPSCYGEPEKFRNYLLCFNVL